MRSGPGDAQGGNLSQVIIADRREDGRRIKRLLELGLEVRIQELLYGDYLWQDAEGRVWGVEAKTGSDLLGSISSGRLHHQASGLVASCDVPVLAVEWWPQLDRDGILRVDGVRTRWRWNSVIALLAALELRGVIVLHAKNGHEWAMTLKTIYELAMKPEQHRAVLQRNPVSYFNRGIAPQLRVLMGFEGVSEKRARELLEHFGSLEKVFEATTKELMQVRGIGRKVAQGLRDTLTSPVP